MENENRLTKESLKSRGFKNLLKLTRSKKFWEKSGDDLMKAIERRRLLSDAPPKKLHESVNIIKGEMNGNSFYMLEPIENKQSNKSIFYIHGGAYVYRISRLHWHFLGRLVKELNCTITVPLYPLAPESTYEETLAHVYELYIQERSMMDNPGEMILMGDSAGGGLALALAQTLKEKQIQQPKQIILISPWLDVSLSNPEITPIEERDPFLVRKGLQEAGQMYAGEADPKHPKVSPIYGDLAGLDNITLFMGTDDILLADARKFVQLAEDQGTRIDYIEAPQMVHIYPIYNFPESQIALDQIVSRIQQFNN